MIEIVVADGIPQGASHQETSRLLNLHDTAAFRGHLFSLRGAHPGRNSIPKG